MFRSARVLGAVLAATVATAAFVPAGAAGAAPAGHSRLQQVLDRLTTADGAPGALADVRDRTGRTVLTSGVADTTTHAPVPEDSRFRIGSRTKTFTATVVLQLVGEHKVDLDAPIERYLPGLIRGNGNDGRKITVRELLQHTSGLPDCVQYLNPAEILAHPLTHYDPIDLLRLALAHPREFKPGKQWKYSNTNYVVAGMLIEKVTGHTYADEVTRRVIRPLDLRATFAPSDDAEIPGPHPHGYVEPGDSAPYVDITVLNPTIAGSAGGMISDGADLNRFMDALVHGRLLRPAQLKEMMTTRPTGDSSGRAYGLGLESNPLPCGGVYWGHGGDILGFATTGGVTLDGRQATVMSTLDPGRTQAQDDDMSAAVTTALCDGR